MNRGKTLAIIICSLALGLAACARKGPVERTGEKVDHMIDTVKNGGEEPTGDKIQDQVDKAREKAADIADKTTDK
jgi:predicted small lipoprotein YifL